MSFLYMTCQRGAERVLKEEILRRCPDFRFSYSQPGFLTWRYERAPEFVPKSETIRSVFARTYIQGIGKIKSAPSDNQMHEVWRLFTEYFSESRYANRTFRLHIWTPDRAEPGTNGWEPCLEPEDYLLHRELWKIMPARFRERTGYQTEWPDFPGSIDEICLDLVRVGNFWWLGFHEVNDYHSRYPGGLFPLDLPADAASRAWLKFEEGLRWSGFPIEPGSRCVDIGASPGGGSQVLLARGAEVLGVDPALMDSRVLVNPKFRHLQGRISQLRKNLFRKSRWFIADMNVAPGYTLDAFEELVTRPDIAARGLLFTLKFFNWNFAENIPDFIRRIKDWGFNRVKARQLRFNRQEIMVAALKKPFRK